MAWGDLLALVGGGAGGAVRTCCLRPWLGKLGTRAEFVGEANNLPRSKIWKVCTHWWNMAVSRSGVLKVVAYFKCDIY